MYASNCIAIWAESLCNRIAPKFVDMFRGKHAEITSAAGQSSFTICWQWEVIDCRVNKNLPCLNKSRRVWYLIGSPSDGSREDNRKLPILFSFRLRTEFLLFYLSPRPLNIFYTHGWGHHELHGDVHHPRCENQFQKIQGLGCIGQTVEHGTSTANFCTVVATQALYMRSTWGT